MSDGIDLQLSPEMMSKLVEGVVTALRQSPALPAQKSGRTSLTLPHILTIAGLIITIALTLGGGWLNHSTELSAHGERLRQNETQIALINSRLDEAQNSQNTIQSLTAQVTSLQGSVEQLHTDIRDVQQQMMTQNTERRK